jgi:AraC-like DNA-binding protein
MARPNRAGAGDRQTESSHADLISRVVEGQGSDARTGVADSWRRSLTQHHVEPDTASAPNVLTERELKDLREPFDSVLTVAQEEVDHLYAIVRQAGYVVLLCNADGIALQHRGNETTAERFKYWGTWTGGVWSEGVEGTNGIGTCIAEQRPISVHLDQHFRARHIGLSCAGAPIFDARGRLVAVLDTSSIDPELSEHSHGLALAATVTSARAIGEQLFRESFRQSWIVAAAPCDESGSAVLLAVDNDQYIVGGDRFARSELGLDDRSVGNGVHLRKLFDYNGSLFSRRGDPEDFALHLMGGRLARAWRALVTPPEVAFRRWKGPGRDRFHTRPRLTLLSILTPPDTQRHAHPGLSPGAKRRVLEYMDAHFDEQLTLETLARVAGLSLHHFARAFRQSTGEPPHQYLLRRRIERATELLKQPELRLSEIALAVGFSDHSHFARHFRRLVGVTPGAARWAQR